MLSSLRIVYHREDDCKTLLFLRPHQQHTATGDGVKEQVLLGRPHTNGRKAL